MHFCGTKAIPILMHTSNGGFKQSEDTTLYCDPKHWGNGPERALDLYHHKRPAFFADITRAITSLSWPISTGLVT
jgi:hypothetical protein